MPRLFPSPPSTRWLAGSFAGLLMLSACQPSTQDSAPVVADADVAPVVDAVPEPAAAVEPVRLSFTTDAPHIGSQVGLRTPGLGMSTTGKAGWLLFGPYIPLQPGNYEVAFQGIVQADHAGVVHFDIAYGKGASTLAIKDLDQAALAASALDGTLTTLAFTVSEPISDIEVRISVTEQSNLAVAGFVIRATP